MRTVTELAIANSDLIQLSYDPGKVSTAWDDQEMGSVAASLSYAHSRGAMGSLVGLDLSENAIGDAGLTALATAIGSGALPNLKNLVLSFNQYNCKIVDAGLTALADAVRSGALPNLDELRLDFNNIGDAGLTALADAVRSGALPISLR